MITQVLTRPNAALSGPGVDALGDCYKQLNSSVGEFGTSTLQVATKAIESNSSGDRQYLATDRALAGLDVARDGLAGVIKGDLEAAAFRDAPVRGATALTVACNVLIGAAQHLASGH